MTLHRVCVFSDVHLPEQHLGAWRAFKDWHQYAKPEITIANGDIIDLAMLSRFDPYEGMPHKVKASLRTAIRELNALRKQCGQLIVRPGNHEDRWDKAVLGKRRDRFEGIDLSLRRTLLDLGLDPSIRWESDSNEAPATWLGRKAVAVFHGHRQAGPYGAKNVAALNSNKFPTLNVVVGHHHRAQLMCKTVLGKTTWSVACPHLSKDHEYAGTPDWQRGFLVVDLYGGKRLRDCRHATPHLIVMDERGRFAFEGRVWG